MLNSHFRSNLATILEQVHDQSEIVVIKRH